MRNTIEKCFNKAGEKWRKGKFRSDNIDRWNSGNFHRNLNYHRRKTSLSREQQVEGDSTGSDILGGSSSLVIRGGLPGTVSPPLLPKLV